jgi:hypothetical protein
MIRFSAGPNGQTLDAVVVVAFDPASGKVHGTYVHGYQGNLNPAELERCRKRFLADLHARLGSAKIEFSEAPLARFKDGWVERVDPKTRALVTRSARPAT